MSNFDWSKVIDPVLNFAGKVIPEMINKGKNKVVNALSGGKEPELTMSQAEMLRKKAELNAKYGTGWHLEFWRKKLNMASNTDREVGEAAYRFLSKPNPRSGAKVAIPAPEESFTDKEILETLGLLAPMSFAGIGAGSGKFGINKIFILVGGGFALWYFLIRKTKKKGRR